MELRDYIRKPLIQIITTRQRSDEKVMLSDVSVCLFMRGGVHVTTTHDAIGESRGSRGPSNTSSNMFTGEPPALLPRHFQTCSLCSPTSISKWTVGLRLTGLFVLYLFSMRLG